MRAAMGVLALLSTPFMASAQDTAEAAITLPDRTVFLSADNTSSAVPMVARDGDALHLMFAQLHLGFPLPPTLTVTLSETGTDTDADTDTGWRVDALTYDDPSQTLALTTRAFRVAHDRNTLTLTGAALLPLPLGPEFRDVVIVITLGE